jgi:hypothetical protein
MNKPFDVFAEGLVSRNSRGDWTRLELFQTGVACWELQVKRLLLAALGFPHWRTDSWGTCFGKLSANPIRACGRPAVAFLASLRRAGPGPHRNGHCL